MIHAVNDQGQESAGRELVVQPVTVDFILNPDPAGQEYLSIAGTFDTYSVRLSNVSGTSDLNFDQIAIYRETTGAVILDESFSTSVALDAGGQISHDIVIHHRLTKATYKPPVSPRRLWLTREAVLSSTRTSASKLAYALARLPLVSIAAQQPPLAGGLTDFTVTFTNRGRTSMDFVLVRNGGQDAGDLTIDVLNGEDQLVAVTEFSTFISGLGVTASQEAYLRLILAKVAALPCRTSSFLKCCPRRAKLNCRAHGQSPLRDRHAARAGDWPVYQLHLIKPYGDRVLWSMARPVRFMRMMRRLLFPGKSGPCDCRVPDKELTLGFDIQGFRAAETVTTDGNGQYSFDYTPTLGIAGEIDIWASHPDVDKLDQTTIVVYRSFLAPSRGDIRMSKMTILSSN